VVRTDDVEHDKTCPIDDTTGHAIAHSVGSELPPRFRGSQKPVCDTEFAFVFTHRVVGVCSNGVERAVVAEQRKTQKDIVGPVS
jgi:hypothetical protein